MPEAEYKRCTKCDEVKPLDQFTERMKRGCPCREAQCKPCKGAADKAWREANRKHVVEHARKYWGENPERKAAKDKRYAKRHRDKVYENKRAYEARHPSKPQARRAVNNAIRDGRLTKPTACFDCGKEVRLQAHHHDYSKPFEVEWLCHGCHRARHRPS